MGKFYRPFSRTDWLPGNLIASGAVVFCWAYFIYTGSVATIWPMFGSANQLLATIALAVGTTYIVNRGKITYAWVTLIPMAFVGITTCVAGVKNMTGIYIPMLSQPEHSVQGLINLLLTTVIMICVVVIIRDSLPIWIRAARERRLALEKYPDSSSNKKRN
jgi:carbon starvation protein